VNRQNKIGSQMQKTPDYQPNKIK